MAQHNLFQKKPRLYLDGGMGTMLQKSGMPAGEIPENTTSNTQNRLLPFTKRFWLLARILSMPTPLVQTA